MAKINLTEEEKVKLIELINNDAEIPLELLQKLGPGFFEKLAKQGKFDFETLEKFKIPTIEYAGKRPENVILASAALTGGNAPLQVERCFEAGKYSDGKSQLSIFEESKKEDKNWRNLIVQGDNLQFLKTCYINKDPLIKDRVKGRVKLIYIDPPFGTGDEYGGKNDEISYSAKIMGSEFLESLRERLIYLREILSKDGIIFIRLDYHFSHYFKAIADEVFDKNQFQNELIVNRIRKNVTKQGRQSMPTATDSIFIYFKSNSSKFISVFKKLEKPKDGYWRAMDSAGLRSNPQRVIEGKVFNPPRGRHFTFNQEKVNKMYAGGRIRLNPNSERPEYWVKPKKTIALDTNWTDISGYSFTTGYPTENSEPLLKRIIEMASDEDDLIIDCFAGSGTTGAVAEKLGRRWIMCDFGKHAIYVMQKRMLRISESKKLGENAKKNEKYGKGPNPFCVVSCGGYDFTRIMNLRENKEAYITFVLGLFNLSKSDDDLVKKYKLPNVYSEKEGNPVEVFPVWEDEYLKSVKVDEEYLKGIISQSGGKLKGEYYIITPITCTSIGDTTLQNDKKEKINFKLLTFPYKVLEEAARSFAIHEQPSSEANINDLISSAGFYFNEDVKIEAKKIKDGIQITKFSSDITDVSGKKFKNLEGLAMVLVDKDYNGKVFDMEEAVYASGIDAEGKMKITGITKETYLIAVDKHGNESKPTKVK